MVLKASFPRSPLHLSSPTKVESSRLPRSTKLGTAYYVYDAIGSGLVACVKTTSGDILRLRE